MTRDSETTDRLRRLIDQITSLTEKHELQWERQSGSAHRYARWNNHLLILGPATPISGAVPRYLFITPFIYYAMSPSHLLTSNLQCTITFSQSADTKTSWSETSW